MENRVAMRAILHTMITADDLAKVQAREKKLGYILLPWQVLETMNLPSMKDFYGVPNRPEKDHLVKRWVDGISSQIRSAAMLTLGDEIAINGGDLETLHAFDTVFARRRGEIDFIFKDEEYEQRKPGRRLVDIMKDKQEADRVSQEL